MLNWLRKRFYSRWELLDAMTPGKWYYGRDLHEETGYSLANMHEKLEQLREEGYVEERSADSEYVHVNDRTYLIVRVEYRTTTKRKPEQDRSFVYGM